MPVLRPLMFVADFVVDDEEAPAIGRVVVDEAFDDEFVDGADNVK